MESTSNPDYRELRKEEYETQFFGFSSRALFVHLKDSISENFNSAALGLQDALVKKLGSDEDEVKEATNILRQKCDFAVQKYSGDLQSGCDSNFGIPDCVLLPEDSAQCVQYSSEEAENLDRELDCLKIRLIEARAMNQYMAREKEEFENLKSVMEKIQNTVPSVSSQVIRKLAKQKQKLKKLVEPTASISSFVPSGINKDNLGFLHALVEEKFSCSPSE